MAFGPGQATGSLFVTESVERSDNASPAGPNQAVLALATGDTCLRWCGAPAAVIAALVQAALALPTAWSQPAREPWLAGGNLACNHWFSAVPGQ